jgi:hypothetical protein
MLQVSAKKTWRHLLYVNTIGHSYCVLSTQFLISELRDCFQCQIDYIAQGDFSEDPNTSKEIRNRDMTPSGGPSLDLIFYSSVSKARLFVGSRTRFPALVRFPPHRILYEVFRSKVKAQFRDLTWTNQIRLIAKKIRLSLDDNKITNKSNWCRKNKWGVINW